MGTHAHDTFTASNDVMQLFHAAAAAGFLLVDTWR
jgi:hypothetical protein